MGFSYLGGKNWREITRDERTYCADLYMLLKKKEKLIIFTNWLCEKCNIDKIETSGEIEICFEVTFLRDVLFDYELSKGKKVAGKDRIKGSLKRTLDLAIFLPNDIIIIEAKAAESLTTKQMEDFKKDEAAINALLKALGRKSPRVHLVGLVSSEYKPSSGTLNMFENRIIKWNDIPNSGIGYELPEALNTIYSCSSKIKRAPKIETDNMVSFVNEIEAIYLG
jgi:hypothetical protein